MSMTPEEIKAYEDMVDGIDNDDDDNDTQMSDRDRVIEGLRATSVTSVISDFMGEYFLHLQRSGLIGLETYIKYDISEDLIGMCETITLINSPKEEYKVIGFKIQSSILEGFDPVTGFLKARVNEEREMRSFDPDDLLEVRDMIAREGFISDCTCEPCSKRRETLEAQAATVT